MGEVHANDIETSRAELVDGLDRVRFGANCADDGSSAVVLGRLKLKVTLLLAQFFLKGSSKRLRLSWQQERIQGCFNLQEQEVEASGYRTSVFKAESHSILVEPAER
jgi:hypothetical protein